MEYFLNLKKDNKSVLLILLLYVITVYNCAVTQFLLPNYKSKEINRTDKNKIFKHFLINILI